MNKKGFTLIELLASIVIMGLIVAMVVPSINSLQNNNKKKPYELYGESMLEAAKLFVTKEGEDLTSLGTEDWTGCIDIPYQTLIDNDYIKPYDQVRTTGEKENPIVCSGKVRYTKPDNQYTYQLECTQNGKKVYSYQNITGDTCTQTKT